MSVGFQASGPPLVPQRDAFDKDCPGRAILDKITSRWGVLILAALRDEPLRFHALRDRIDGISEKMLSQNLRTFTDYGFTERTVEPTSPPKVTYALTPMGAEVAERMHDLLTWVGTHTDTIMDFRSRSVP